MRFEAYLTVIILIILSACSGADRALLKQADSVMEENPDSALTILLTIDRDRISDRDLPYYALLMTQAMVKTDVPVGSDSLISIAYTKYSGDWRGDKGIRASFYMGEVFYNQENPRYAIRHYLSAYEEAKRLRDHYWHAKAAERIADLFFDAYRYDEAVKYRMEAIENFGKSNRTSNQRYAIADLTAAYYNNGKKDLALQILDSLMYECNRSLHTDENLIAYILQHRVHTDNWHTPIRLTLYEDMTDRGKIEATILSCNSESWKNDYNRNDSALRNIVRYACDKEDSLHILYSRYLKIRSYQKESPILKFVDSLGTSRISGAYVKMG